MLLRYRLEENRCESDNPLMNYVSGFYNMLSVTLNMIRTLMLPGETFPGKDGNVFVSPVFSGT